MSLLVDWSVTLNGQDATAAFNDFVEKIEVSGKAGGSADTATLTLDDADGQIVWPSKGSPIEIGIEGRRVFKGTVSEPQSVGSRGGGQQIEVECTGFDDRSKIKAAQSFHKDDCTLKDFLSEAASKAGLSGITIDPAFAAIKRAWWSTCGRNFLQLGQALADELGGTFKVRGDKAVLAKRGGGTTPGGATVATLAVTHGQNLLTWRMTPMVGRKRWKKARARYYDRAQAKWVEKDLEVGSDPNAADTVDLVGDAKPDADAAERAGKGRKTASEREGGQGTVTILLAVEAEVEGACEVEGIRPGIDGTYRIEAWTHTLTRSGSETRLELKQPTGKAGTDSRSKAAKATSGGAGRTVEAVAAPSTAVG